MGQSAQIYGINRPCVIVNDSDANIRYNGTWIVGNETEIQSVIPLFARAPMFNTLHVLPIFNGSVSYDFTGGGISVFATPFDNSTYTAQCFLDGNQLDLDPNAAKEQFGQSQPVCQAFGLPDSTPHTISVVVSVPPRQQQDFYQPLSGFAFDYFLIQPPLGTEPWDNGNQDTFLPVIDTAFIENNTSTLNSEIMINGPDGQIANVSREWIFDPENGFRTTTPGSQINVSFTGTALWWYGYYNGTLSQPNPSVTFVIDQGAPSTFIVKPVLPSPASRTFLFKTPVLQYGTHLLTAVYDENGLAALPLPLTLQSFIIQKSIQRAVVPSSTLELMPSTIMSKLPTSSSSTRRVTPSDIALGIGGGFIFLLLVVSGLCVLIRRTRSRRQWKPAGAHSITEVLQPFGVHTEGNLQIIIPRKARASQLHIDHPLIQPLQPAPLTEWSRFHAFPDSSACMPNSSATIPQDRGLLGSPVNPPLIPNDSHLCPTGTVTIDRRSVAQIGDTLHQSAPNVIGATHLSGPEGGGEGDLPPAYTTH